MPSCMACLSQDLEALRNPDQVLENPQDFFDPSQPVFSTDRVRFGGRHSPPPPASSPPGPRALQVETASMRTPHTVAVCVEHRPLPRAAERSALLPWLPSLHPATTAGADQRPQAPAEPCLGCHELCLAVPCAWPTLRSEALSPLSHPGSFNGRQWLVSHGVSNACGCTIRHPTRHAQGLCHHRPDTILKMTSHVGPRRHTGHTKRW